jgi:predicted TIM-barrel fold metal-dependent hydrolase
MEVAGHYGFDRFVSMSPLEEAVGLIRDWPGRFQFIAVPQWGNNSIDDWLRRIEAFYNLGSRMVKFHMAPGTMAARGWHLDSPELRPIFQEIMARKMGIMTHVGDPDTWYAGRYSDAAKFGTREEHNGMLEHVLEEYRGIPWVGAHMGGNPENLGRLQYLLDKFPDYNLDCSATRWVLRELGLHRDASREFFIRNQNRILFGTDQVTGDDRGWDFLASRFWCHRKMWETAYLGTIPIFDPDMPEDNQPLIRGLALPDATLQKLYHDNAFRFLQNLGADMAGWE